MSADTRLGLGIPTPDSAELAQITPEAVKARIRDFFQSAKLGRLGVSKPDNIRTVTVTATNAYDNDHRYPQLEERGDIKLFSRGRLYLREAEVTVNGISFAKTITPARPIPFFQTEHHSHRLISSGDVTAIHQLYGVYETPREWHAFPGRFEVAISVLDFNQGSSRVFFPFAVGGYILPDSEKARMARSLGV